MVPGKACFVAHPESKPDHPYRIESVDLEAPAHSRAAPGQLHAKLRSLVDDTKFVCAIHDLVPLARYFADRWRRHAENTPMRKGLLEAVRVQARRNVPESPFEAVWKEISSGLPLPTELRPAGAHEVELPSAAGSSSAPPPIVEDKKAHDAKLLEAEMHAMIADEDAPPGNPHLVRYDSYFGVPTARAPAASASSSAAAPGSGGAADSPFVSGDAVWLRDASVNLGVAAVVVEVLGPTSYRVARLSGGEVRGAVQRADLRRRQTAE